MEVILREDVPGLGIIGDVVRVKPGYARNYLLPRGMAVAADRRNLKQLEHHKRVIEAKAKRERGTHEAVARAMEGLVLEIEGRAGKGGKLFGSVTNIDVHRMLQEKGFEIDRRRIELKDHIKEIGEYPVVVRVGQDVRADVKVVVKPLGGQLEDRSVGGDEEDVVSAAGAGELATAETPGAGAEPADDESEDPMPSESDASESDEPQR